MLGSLPELTADWLGSLGRAFESYGPIVRLRTPWPLDDIVAVCDPHAVEQIFVTDVANYRKPLVQRMVAPVIGGGLLLAEGEQWRKQRRFVQPAFHRAKVAEYGGAIADAAEAMVASWPDEGERDVYADAAELALRVAAGTMFGAELGANAHDVQQALGEAIAAFNAYFNARFPLPPSIPTPAARRMRRAARKLQSVVSEFVAARRQSGEDRGDLIGMLLEARDEQGRPLTELELRDETVTLFLAGAETTAVALAWTLHLLARHPEEAGRIRAELATVARPIHAEQVPSLPYTTKVVKEAMRLCPPAWIVGREAVRDCTVGGFAIPEGTQVMTCAYWMHRNPSHFPEPERFWPERWSEQLSARLPRLAYFPFGGGQRLCIGHQFAMMELIIAVATVVAAADLRPTDPAPVPQPAFTLRPRAGVRLEVRRRQRTAAARSIPLGEGPRP